MATIRETLFLLETGLTLTVSVGTLVGTVFTPLVPQPTTRVSNTGTVYDIEIDIVSSSQTGFIHVLNGVDLIASGALDVPPAVVGSAMTLAANAVTAAALATDAVAEIANGLLDLTDGVETGETVRQNMRRNRAILGGLSDADNSEAGTVAFKRKDGTTTALTATYNAQGDRTVITEGTL